MADNVGQVSLGVVLDSQDLLSQFNSLGLSAAKILSDSLAKGAAIPSRAFDMSGMISAINTGLKDGFSGMSKEITSAVKDSTKAIDFLSDRIQESMTKSAEVGAAELKASVEKAATSIKMPKLDVKYSEADWSNILDTTMQKLDLVNASIGGQQQKVDELREKWDMFNNSGQSGSPQAQSIEAELIKAETALNGMVEKSNAYAAQVRSIDAQIASMGQKSAQGMEVASTSIDKAINKTLSAGEIVANTGHKGKTAGKVVSMAMKEAASSTKKLGTSAGVAGNGFKNLTRLGLGMMGIRSVMLMVRRLTTSVIDGMKAAANQFPQFGAQMDSLSRATGTLKGAFSAMFIPIVQAVIPAIQKLVGWLTTAFNAVAKLFGALSGKKTVLVAVDSTNRFTKSAENSAGAAGDATKANEKLKRSLAGFDEIEILPSQKQDTGGSAGGGGGAGEAGPIFEEVSTGLGEWKNKIAELLTMLGKSPAFKKLADAAKTAFGVIKRSADNALSRITTSWNENAPRAFEAMKNIGKNVFEVLADVASYISIPFVAGGLAAAIDFVGAFVDGVLKLGADMWELADSILSPFLTSISDFFAEHGPAISSLIYETWAVISDGLIGIWDGLVEIAHQVFGGLIEWFNTHGEEIKTFFTNTWETVWGILEPIWNAINTVAQVIFGALRDFFFEIAPKIRDVIVSAWDAVWNIIKPLWEAILKIAKFIFGQLKEFWRVWGDTITKFFSNTWNAIKGIFGGALDVIAGVFKIFAAILSGDWEKLWEGIKQVATGIWNILKSAFEGVLNAIGSILSVFGFDVSAIWDNITGVFQGVIDFITGVFTGNWKQAWNGVVNIFKNIISGLGNIIKTPINWIIDALNWFIRGVNKIKIPDWVPLIGGKGINIGLIPRLATGGVIDQPTVAMVGEAGKEAVMPLERNTGWITDLARQIAEVNGGGGGGDIQITMPIYLMGEHIDTVIEHINRRGRQANEPLLEW